jgi:hypothetical protein
MAIDQHPSQISAKLKAADASDLNRLPARQLSFGPTQFQQWPGLDSCST